MRIGQRLLIAVAPGIIGVLAVAGLAYWGERNRQIPTALLAIAAAAIVFSLWFAWVTTRDLAHRIERLGKLVDARQSDGNDEEHSLLIGLARETLSRLSGSGRAGADELDPVERLVARFDGELARIDEQKRAAEDRVTEARAESARLLYDAGDRIAKRMDEVRLPLHVLLDTPFGELNENQEEMIGAARVAAEAASDEARSIRDLAALELSAGGRRDRVMASDLMRAVLPLLKAEARRGNVSLKWDLAPALPAVIGDRARLQEAVREVLSRLVRAADPESEISISTVGESPGVAIHVTPVRNIAASELAIETRVLDALGARFDLTAGNATITLPLWR